MAINYEEEFRKHWRWMAERGNNSKNAYFTQNGIVAVEGDCFACQYCTDILDPDHTRECEDICPVGWPNNNCMDADSPFYKWLGADTIDDRKHYAKIISELPWVEK